MSGALGRDEEKWIHLEPKAGANSGRFFARIWDDVVRYPGALVAVIAAPRRFLRGFDSRARTQAPAATFLALSCLGGVGVETSLLMGPTSSLPGVLVPHFILLLTSTLLCGAVLVLSWRLSGVTSVDPVSVTLYCYHAGAFNVMVTATNVTFAGVIAYVADVPGRQALVAVYRVEQLLPLLRGIGPEISVLVCFVALLSALLIYAVWGIGAWLAYRDVYGGGWLRTAGALCLYVCGSFVVVFAFAVLRAVLYSEG